AFARRNGLATPPQRTRLPHRHPHDPTAVERRTQARAGQPVVEFYTVRGGGHVVPQPTFKFPRLMGRMAGDLNLPAQAVAFFGLAK
ncbi:MAG: hypothetical protein M3Y12_08045, partial [Bacteroidota bacterium]|nr:hypothetical protein [Bacteroidota bacterium]